MEPADLQLNGVAVNVTVPEPMQWTDVRRGEEFTLTSITLRLRPDGTVATRAYGRSTAGGRGGYTSFPVPPGRPDLTALVESAAALAARSWRDCVIDD